MKKLSLADVPKFLGQVGAVMDLFAPIRMSGATNWGVWDKDRKADLNLTISLHVCSILPGKKLEKNLFSNSWRTCCSFFLCIVLHRSPVTYL